MKNKHSEIVMYIKKKFPSKKTIQGVREIRARFFCSKNTVPTPTGPYFEDKKIMPLFCGHPV